MLRFLLWRLLALIALLSGCVLLTWFLAGGPGRLLRGGEGAGARGHQASLLDSAWAAPRLIGKATDAAWNWVIVAGIRPVALSASTGLVVSLALLLARWRARHRRRYVRLRLEAYRTDQASAEAVVKMYQALHKRLLSRWWRRLVFGQPSVALEVQHKRAAGAQAGFLAWLSLSCPSGLERMIEAAVRTAYPNAHLEAIEEPLRLSQPVLLRLKKDFTFIRRVSSLDHFEHQREPPINRLLTTMGACGAEACLQIALTPAPIWFERWARRRFKLHEAQLSRERRDHAIVRDRSMVDDVELRGGLDVQHRPLFFADLRVLGNDRLTCERIASELRVESAENRLVERGSALRHGLLSLDRRRIERGEGNPLPGFHRGVYASSELASLWHLPSIDYLAVPFARRGLPLAPAPPAILRPSNGQGTLRDAIGQVSIHRELRKQNTAVVGTVEQGKSSYLIATVAEDLRRERCAVIVLDPKGDAADAAVSLVSPERRCTLLDFARPTCGFNPLAVDAPADVIADYVVAALRNLFDPADIRASSDRYLRNAIIAVLAYDRQSTLWDAARLLSVGEEGYAYRRSVGARVRALPEFKEISTFFTSELAAQLADSRSTTTAKLDAPVNKLARLLNSASIKRVLLNDSLTVDFDRVIGDCEVLVVKGALGVMGAGNTSVLMQLLVGMLDAALARQQDLLSADQRVAVALKVDEAPLVLHRGFAETMALKRSAGLETVACWQTDAQWIDREVREQLDALFAHRVYFATASTRDARDAVGLTMSQFSDAVRPGIDQLSVLGRPDARLHLPKHQAIASWTTSEGRQSPFIGQTLPLRIDLDRLALHAKLQHERGGRHRSDLRQPHWQRRDEHRDEVNGGAADRVAAAHDGVDWDVADRPAPARSTTPAARARVVSWTLPDVPCESYSELVALDLAQSARWPRPLSDPRTIEPDGMDLEMLALIARSSHLLSSQLHRQLNRDGAMTTTQRRLKRLSDAGLVERFQFHRRDGGGVPMCYLISPTGRELLQISGDEVVGAAGARLSHDVSRAAARDALSVARRLREARRDVHVAGWVCSLLQSASDPSATWRGRQGSILEPPLTSIGAGRRPLALGDLQLAGGRVPHDFVRSGGLGEPAEVERFETVRPDAIVELGTAGIDVLVEFDDRLPTGAGAAKLERYDHFLTGWSTHTRRYGERGVAKPLLVVVCRDRSRARRCAELADSTMRACRAYAGEYPFDWDYVGRCQTLFAAERDVHEGLLCAYGLLDLPPHVRVARAHGDPQAGEAAPRPAQILS